MSVLINPITEQNFELVRDQLGAILKDELASQAALQPTEEALKNVKVFIDRLVVPNKAELPLINIFMDSGVFNNQDVEAQDGVYTFNIDCFFSGKSGASDARGDQRSLRNLQRLMGVIRGIIQSTKYQTLGFDRPSVLFRGFKAIFVSDPTKSQDGSNVSQGRLTLEVRLVESAEMFASTLLAGTDTKVKLSDTEKGFEYTIDI